MREILFRAKRVDNGEWVEGYLFDDGMAEVEHYFVGRIVVEPYKGTACDDWDITGIDFCEVNPETLCQYTGLKDKNGNRIWENDIVKYMWFGNEEVDIVEYRSTSIGLKENYNAVLTDITEVIGNIFDDKHLLAETDYCREQEKETEDSHGE